MDSTRPERPSRPSGVSWIFKCKGKATAEASTCNIKIPHADPHGEAGHASSMVSRNIEAIFGRQWVMAAQKAGRGLDMGGFPSGKTHGDNAANSGISTIRDTDIPTAYPTHDLTLDVHLPPSISPIYSFSTGRAHTGSMNGDPRTDDGNGSTLTTMGHFATTKNIASTSAPTIHGSSGNTITSSTLAYTGNDWNPSYMTQGTSGTHSPSAAPVHGDRSSTSTALAHAKSNRTSLSLAGTDISSTVVSHNYRGDTTLPESISAPIRVQRSISLYIRGMGASVTFSDILAAIRNTGKVYSLFVNPPSETHHGSAAKICFFTRAAAEKLYNATRDGFLAKGDGCLAEVVWNRVLVPEHTRMDWRNACRVVLVRGPKRIVNHANILAIIDANIRMYDLDRVTERVFAPIRGFSQVEMQFGSFRAQGHSAFIVHNRALAGKAVQVLYGADPCS